MISRLRVLFFVEGFTDIRFVVGLSEICNLALAMPETALTSSGLKQRIVDSGINVQIVEIPGGRLAFQFRSLAYLLRNAGNFDVILAQEVLRGALNANLAGWLYRVPVVTIMGIAPAEYFRCRYERKQISWWRWKLGDTVIRTLMTINGRLSTRSLTGGTYLRRIAKRYSPRTGACLYYGVDVDLFRPASADERRELRRKWKLPEDKFLIFLASRISHEKDPETALRAASLARQRGLDLMVLNLGGGYKDFLTLAKTLNLADPDLWVMGGPALHPMKDLADIFRAVDLVVQASLVEGLGMSPLESLACGTPVVATEVGGMAEQLKGLARLVPLRDPEAMADQFQWVASHGDSARAQALAAREMCVVPEWNRKKAYGDLRRSLEAIVQKRLDLEAGSR